MNQCHIRFPSTSQDDKIIIGPIMHTQSNAPIRPSEPRYGFMWSKCVEDKRKVYRVLTYKLGFVIAIK